MIDLLVATTDHCFGVPGLFRIDDRHNTIGSVASSEKPRWIAILSWISTPRKMMKISDRDSSVLKSQMESILHFAAEWVSLKEMKALQGACVLTSIRARERQYEELLSDLDD